MGHSRENIRTACLADKTENKQINPCGAYLVYYTQNSFIQFRTGKVLENTKTYGLSRPSHAY